MLYSTLGCSNAGALDKGVMAAFAAAGYTAMDTRANGSEFRGNLGSISVLLLQDLHLLLPAALPSDSFGDGSAAGEWQFLQCMEEGY